MSTKFFVVLFMILASFLARAEKTYKKSSTECSFADQKISFVLSDRQRFTSSEDDDYGETLTVRLGVDVQQLDLSERSGGRYRFIESQNSICSNPLAMKIDEDEFAIFLGRDNRPFPDTLVVVQYNVRTKSLHFTKTKIQARAAFSDGTRSYFRLSNGSTADQFGTVHIGSKRFNFIDKTLEPWISFDGKNFRLDRETTFERFEHKRLIKKTDLEHLSEFQDLRYKYATSPGQSKECFSLNGGPWNCR
jgi:hypothetical protein